MVHLHMPAKKFLITFTLLLSQASKNFIQAITLPVLLSCPCPSHPDWWVCYVCNEHQHYNKNFYKSVAKNATKVAPKLTELKIALCTPKLSLNDSHSITLHTPLIHYLHLVLASWQLPVVVVQYMACNGWGCFDVFSRSTSPLPHLK